MLPFNLGTAGAEVRVQTQATFRAVSYRQIESNSDTKGTEPSSHATRDTQQRAAASRRKASPRDFSCFIWKNCRKEPSCSVIRVRYMGELGAPFLLHARETRRFAGPTRATLGFCFVCSVRSPSPCLLMHHDCEVRRSMFCCGYAMYVVNGKVSNVSNFT